MLLLHFTEQEMHGFGARLIDELEAGSAAARDDQIRSEG
jgi:hypothetical protein